MSVVNKNSKSNLAKLLATENLDVVHKQIPTAYFNVKTRELGLPIWDKASPDVYDLLVGHEVGHALFTPTDFPVHYSEIDSEENHSIVQSYVNVVEDARIEKLMKRKYSGLSKSFFKGYSEMFDNDFFGLEDRKPSDFSLLDRINLHFKVGNFLKVPFSDDEKVMVEKVAKAETFEDVISVVKEIYTRAKAETDNHKDFDFDDDGDLSEPSDLDSSNDAGTELSDSDDGESSEESSSTEENSDDSAEGGSAGHSNSPPEASETEKSISDSIQEHVNDDNAYDKVYAKIPEVNSSDYILDYKIVHDEISEWIRQTKPEEFIPYRKAEFSKFKKDQMKSVNYLVKEFELKKNASQYARASESKTGVLDVTKIHSYKFNDDLFKKVTVVPDGKNHGLVFFIDFSGSMESSIGPTIKQVINLVMFCQKINIPFEVYSFTDIDQKNLKTPTRVSYDDYGQPKILGGENEMVLGQFAMRNYFSSRMKRVEFDTAMFNMFILAREYSNGYYYNVNGSDSLGGTPLNECLMASYDLVEKFQSSNNLEKVNVVYLTDGESAGGDCMVGIDEDGEKMIKSIRYRSFYNMYKHDSPAEAFLVDPKTKIQYPLVNRLDMTNALLMGLRDRLNINVIGFFIAPQVRHLQSALRISGLQEAWYNKSDMKKYVSSFNKNKSIVLDSVGYTNFIVIKGGKELDVDDGEKLGINPDMKKGQMTTAFKKHQKGKTLNRVVLNKFVELIS